ncbi:MAG: Mur ligase domain-containing protein, partial [Bacteroidales bacterium]|nr:Mur ligase domain-containing protein [Bacteroidales bacterium]
MMEHIYQRYLLSRKVTTDSRNCPQGSIYFALKGERFNGNDFALDALSKGCDLAVVDEEGLKDKTGCFWVPDALEALQKLAAYHRQSSGVKIVGITGSNGKTTTKELLAQVLS